MSENINIYGLTPRDRSKRDSQYYYNETQRLKGEVMTLADSLVGKPKRFSIDNGIEMDVEVTKSDLRNIVNKFSDDFKFNAIRNALVRDLEKYLNKAKYEGWREVEDGKHSEVAFFAYYSRALGAKTYLCMRKVGKVFKPYAIVDEKTFLFGKDRLRKDKPSK